MKIERWPHLALSIVCAVGLARCARAESHPWCGTPAHYFRLGGVQYDFAQTGTCYLVGFNPKILGSPSGLATIPSSPAGSPGIPTSSQGPGIVFSSNVTGASGEPVPWWVHILGFTYGSKVVYSASFPDQTPYCYDNQQDFCGGDQYMQLTAMSSGTFYPAFGGAGLISFKGIDDNNHFMFGSGIGRSTDIDADGDTDEADENAMRAAIANPPGDSKFDLNFMGGATTADLQILLEEANRRWPGTNNRYLRGSCKTAPGAAGLPPCNTGSEFDASFWMGNYDPADLHEVAPATPSVSASGKCTTILVSWADTGDDGTTGQAMTYEVRRSTSAITTETAWSSATVVTVGTPGPNGTLESVYDALGGGSGNYYYAVRLMDDQLNWSGIGSTSTTVHTLCKPPILREEAPLSPETTTDGPGPAHFEIARGTPTTLIGPVDFRFSIPTSMRGQELSVDILDVGGRVIRHMEGGTTAQARSSVHWDLRRLDGSKAAAGVYFMRATVGTTSLTWRLVLAR